MYDRIEKIGRSTIQHGPMNNRIYLIKLHHEDMPGIIPSLDRIAANNGYTKIFAKIPAALVVQFESAGYLQEAFVPQFYNSSLDAAFMGKYLDEDRGQDSRDEKTREILGIAAKKQAQGITTDTTEQPSVEKTGVEDVVEMSTIYKEVFPTYPFPIHDPGYLLETMRHNVRYYCIRHEGHIVSLASAEMDREGRNVEMTDFATLSSHRGAGHAVHLLDRMEDDMVNRDIPTAYTIARAMSPGMNVTFAKLDYIYAGTLVNNTDISGNIESMNVWYKHL